MPSNLRWLQVKYVVELVKNLALHPMVHRIDLLTRLIEDPKIDSAYAEEEEMLVKGHGELGGAFIVRIKCGDPKQYLPKEDLWPHVREYATSVAISAEIPLRSPRIFFFNYYQNMYM